MPYTVRSSERTQHSASTTETKALLYLMNFREDSDQIYYFIVDFFNDVTGMDMHGRKLWDAQSKGSTGATPLAIGKELVTLFKNYCSDIEFCKYILFVGGVSDSLKAETDKSAFTISSLSKRTIQKIREGLEKEAVKKSYISAADICDEKIEGFLKEVIVVIDDKEPEEYIKSIVKINPCLVSNESTLTAIFNEIRDKQSGKKNIKVVEGLTIETCDQALHHCRHLTSSEIRLYVLSRLINRDPFSIGVPAPFIEIYNDFPAEKKAEMLEDCKISLSKALCNKSNTGNFWQLFDNIYHVIVANPNFNVDLVFRNLDEDVVRENFHFDVLALKFFIAMIKEGLSI
jgi:hypothetical protein